MKVLVYIKTNVPGSKVEFEVDIDEEEWEEMSDDERDNYLYDEVLNQQGLYWEWDYKVVD